MVSQQLIIQCDVCSVLFTYQTNRNILIEVQVLTSFKTGEA